MRPRRCWKSCAARLCRGCARPRSGPAEAARCHAVSVSRFQRRLIAMLSGAPVFFLKSQEAQARRGGPGRADAIDQAEGLMALRELLYSAAFGFASAF